MSKEVYVHTAFVFTNPSGRTERIPAGLQKLPARITDHWYAKAHIGDRPSEQEAPAVTTLGDLLNGKIDDIMKSVKEDGYSDDEILELIKLEEEGQNRKTLLQLLNEVSKPKGPPQE